MLYKSVGGALQDLIVAEACVRRARAACVGTLLPVSITPVKKGGSVNRAAIDHPGGSSAFQA
jgi:hypothetical protein